VLLPIFLRSLFFCVLSHREEKEEEEEEKTSRPAKNGEGKE